MSEYRIATCTLHGEYIADNEVCPRCDAISAKHYKPCATCLKKYNPNVYFDGCPHCEKALPLIVPKPIKTAPKRDLAPIQAPNTPKLSPTAFKLDVPIDKFGVLIEYVRWYKKSREQEKDYNAFFYDGHWHSIFELWFYVAWQNTGYPMPTPEYKFAEMAGYKFDFAWKDYLIAVVLEGGVFSRGRHTSGIGYKNDCEKYNLATALGWRVYRFTDMNMDNIAYMQARLDEALAQEQAA
jgi:hypothetical protein